MNFLLAWELGGGFGHLARLLPLAERLKIEGHAVMLVLKNTGPSSNKGFKTVVAPSVDYITPFVPSAYTDILYCTAFQSEAALRYLCGEWRDIYKSFRPDVVVCDHAPSAQFAANVSNIPCVQIGHGFFIPPTPSVIFRDDGLSSQSRVDSVHQAVRRNATAVDRRLSKEDPNGFEALGLKKSKAILTTWPELDHYGERKGVTYYGAPTSNLGGETGWFNRGKGLSVFAYLHKDTPDLEDIFQGMAKEFSQANVVITNAPEWANRYKSDNLRIFSAPVDLEEALLSDVIVTNGGHGLVTASILARKHLILSPLNQEQTLISRRVVAANWGASVECDDVYDTAYAPPPKGGIYTASLDEHHSIIIKELLS